MIVTDHADTIRVLIAALKEGWPDESTVAGDYTRREIVSALEAFVAERQQAIDERDRVRNVIELLKVGWDSRPDATLGTRKRAARHGQRTVVKLIEDALLNLGEQP